MGGGASTQRRDSTSKAKQGEGGAKDEVPSFRVGLESARDLTGSSGSMRIEKECLTIVVDGNQPLRWDYHTILCWGSNATSFQFKYFNSLRDLVPVVVETRKGAEIEQKLLKAVKALMETISAIVVDDVELGTLLSEISSCPDAAGSAVRTAAATRKFTAHQGAQIIRTLLEVSAFDAVDAAVVLHGCLLCESSFALILDEFEDQTDRQNVCLRLGIPYPKH